MTGIPFTNALACVKFIFTMVVVLFSILLKWLFLKVRCSSFRGYCGYNPVAPHRFASCLSVRYLHCRRTAEQGPLQWQTLTVYKVEQLKKDNEIEIHNLETYGNHHGKKNAVSMCILCLKSRFFNIYIYYWYRKRVFFNYFHNNQLLFFLP